MIMLRQIPSYIINLLFILIILSLTSMQARASDLAKEKRWSAQIIDSLLVGDAVELKAGDTPFLGIFTPASNGSTERAAIIVHGIGVHPDWPEVISPLRSELPEHGWSTLSVQMPILANDAALKDYLPLFDEVAPRLNAAIAYLREQGNKTIVIIAHSLGASMAARFAADNPGAGIDGLVLISVSVIEIDAKMNSADALGAIKLPVLDLFGSRDLDNVLATRQQRAKAASRKAGNTDYRQLDIEGADHFYVGVEDELLRRVYGWLKSHYEKPVGSRP
jgi:pimeloyl-ACP methyl ester carboxylesterase